MSANSSASGCLGDKVPQTPYRGFAPDSTGDLRPPDPLGYRKMYTDKSVFNTSKISESCINF